MEQQRSDAQNACDQYCADGWLGLYPLGAVANMPGSVVTCSAQAQNQTIADEVAAQCSKTTGASPGATTFALCKLFGRQCNAQQTAKDGTQYCTSMSSVVGGQFTGGCFDSSMTTAELLCQDFFHSFEFPMLPSGAANQSSWFHYWFISQVQPNATEADCQNEANNIGLAAYGSAQGPIGVVHH